MPLSLSSKAIEEKNKLATDSIFYFAIKITIPNIATICLVRNNENITWNGSTYVAMKFDISQTRDEERGEIPEVNLIVSNVSRVIESYLHQYDTYIKANGYSPIVINIYILNSLNLASSTPEYELELELKQPKANSLIATFVLSAVNIFNKRFPPARILKNYCRFLQQGGFKGSLCGYSGAGTTCDGTLETCRGYNNSERFGGAPGVGSGGLRFAV